MNVLAAGSILNETYELLVPLGHGGMGEVWKARHLRLPKEVAIKILTPSAQENPEAVARFRREAEIVSRLGHPNIVEVLDFNTLSDGRTYLVMELLRGEDLRQRLARGLLPIQEALAILRQLSSALHLAHGAGVVHRDLKPENIFLCQRPDVLSPELSAKVLDFGISKIQGSQTFLTGEQSVLGTPAYMSPEQASGKNALIDGRTDQFALAAIGYEMLSGKCAFAGNTLPEVIYKVVFEKTPPLGTINPTLPRHVTAAIDRAMEKDPEQRFPDLAAFARELASAPASTPDVGCVGSAETLAIPTPQPTRLETTLPPLSSPPPESRAPGTGPRPLVGAPSSPPQDGLVTEPSARVSLRGDAGVDPPRAGRRWVTGIALLAVGGVGILLGVLLPRLASEHRGASTLSRRHGSLPKRPTAFHGSRQDGRMTKDAGLAADAFGGDRKPIAVSSRDREKTAPARLGPPRPPRPSSTRSDAKGALPSAVTVDLEAAAAALDRGDFAEAIRLARRSLGGHPTMQAYLMMAKAYCGQRDLGNARGMLRNVPPPQRGDIRRFCRKLGLDIEP